jgi:hypothetical protein
MPPLANAQEVAKKCGRHGDSLGFHDIFLGLPMAMHGLPTDSRILSSSNTDSSDKKKHEQL